MNLRRWTVICLWCLSATLGVAQLREIDANKLPQDTNVQRAYSSALTVEAYARNWSPDWKYPVPKDQVVRTLKSSLDVLKSATKTSPGNAELWMLQGIVAHLAYNVDVQDAYPVAVEALESSRKLAPSDYRVGWVLGIHHCQEGAIKKGMEELLAVENNGPWDKLPLDYWDDYVTCATVGIMPAHSLRAIDRAVRAGGRASNYTTFVDMAKKRYKPTDTHATYSVQDVWQSDEGKSETRFSSLLCGASFAAPGNWKVSLRDFANGTCATTIGTGPYASKTGQSVPNLLIMTRQAKAKETLEQFARSLIATRFDLARAIEASDCPASKCLAWDIVDRNMYGDEGGGHLLTIVFAGEQPDYPGFAFETPLEPPKSKPGKLTYFHPTERLRRLEGTLYSIVVLDSNASIFESAVKDFHLLLKSMQLD